MGKIESPFSALADYMPNGAFEPVMEYIEQYKIHLTITRERKTVLGDYRLPVKGKNHRISVNGNLNKYSFLITLLHELAHLVAFVEFGYQIAAHGKEWQHCYSKILQQFIGKGIFPADIEYEIKAMMHKPAATSCGEDALYKVLRNYDTKKGILLEEVPLEKVFKTDDGRTFIRGPQLRKRIRCQEMETKKWYLFSPVYEVYD